MVGEFGYFALCMALLMALLQAAVPVLALWRNNIFWQHRTAAFSIASSLSVLVSFICLELAFLGDDFSLTYVSEHSNTMLPWYYKLSAVWGGHEGSMLLWVSILALWSVAVVLFSKKLPQAMSIRVQAVLGMIAVGMLSFILFTSSPFNYNFPVLPVDGLDLNPLLQDVGLIIHPPVLYMGYVGLAVPFAFAIAGLWAGRLDSVWASWCRPWVLYAWSFLTLGIALGSWWAYYELGWGGWWFWDPVENASFMPWLAATALLHSLLVTEKRGVFKAWTILLAILAFALSLLGTFLVRSGVLTSVHAFAADPSRGLFVLGILIAVVGGGLLLFALRGWQLTQESTYRLWSRESLLFLNNLILMVATSVVLLGTLYPLIAEAFALGRLSVGPPYFNSFFAPLTWLLLVFMAVAPLTRWKVQTASGWRQQRLPLAAVLLSMLLVLVGFKLLVDGKHGLMTGLTLALCLWVFALLLGDMLRKIRHSGAIKVWLTHTPGSYFGMLLAHAGLLVVIMGVTLTTHMSIEHDVALKVGEKATLADYEFRFEQLKNIQGPNYDAVQATFSVYRQQQRIATLMPEKRFYSAQGKPMTEAAIDGSLRQDIYIALGDALDQQQHNPAWSVRLYIKPYVRLLWIGALLIALGGFVAARDKASSRRRQRFATHQAVAAPATDVSVSLQGGTHE